MKKSIIAVLLVVIFVLSVFTLVACNNQNTDGDNQASQGGDNTNGSDNDSPKEQVITDLIGRKVTLPKEINRVVCIGGGALRLYSYIGDMSMLCGVEDVEKEGNLASKNLALRPYQIVNQELFNSLPSCGVGGPQSQFPEAEKILMCKPDIVFSMYSSDASAMDELQKAINVPVVTFSYGDTEAFDQRVRTSLKLMGEILNREERANELVNYMEDIIDELNALKDKVPQEQKPSLYLACQSNYGFHGFESSSAKYPLFEVSGIKNVMDLAGYSGYSKEVDYETLIKTHNPDKVVIDAGGLHLFKEQYNSNKREVFDQINAFKNNEVYLQLPYNAYYTNLELAYCDAYFCAWVAYPEQLSNFDYVAKSREIIKMFVGSDIYDQVAEYYNGGLQKLDLSKL